MSRTTITLHRGLASEWAAKNPVLYPAEPGFEKDTGKFKIGDGLTHWLDLPYFVPDRESSVLEELQAHIDSLTPHPVYDDGPSLFLLYENAKV